MSIVVLEKGSDAKRFKTLQEAEEYIQNAVEILSEFEANKDFVEYGKSFEEWISYNIDHDSENCETFSPCVPYIHFVGGKIEISGKHKEILCWLNPKRRFKIKTAKLSSDTTYSFIN